MSSKDVVAVVLFGGSGTRLWPLSRQEFPKQFAALAGAQSLFEQTLGRISAISGLKRTICISNKMHRSHVTEVLERSGAQVQVILEPVARNTAPALCCSALVAHQTNPESTLVCLPADHIIQDPHAFVKAIDHAVLEAAHGRIWMTLGVVPTSPASAYGYMLPGEKMTEEKQPF